MTTPITYLILAWLAVQIPCGMLLGQFLHEGFASECDPPND